MKLDTRKPISAVYLMDEKFCTTRQNGVPSGWDYDFRGSATAKEHELNPAHYFTTSADGKYPMTLARTFTVLHKGKASFAYTVQLKSGDGHFVELYSTDNKTAFSIEQKNGMFWINGGMIACPAVNKTHTIGVEFDFDNKNAVVSVNGVLYGTYALLGNDLYKIKMGYKAGSVGACNIVYTGLWINYLVCDKNLVRVDRTMPYDWIDKCDSGSSAGTSFYYEGERLFTYQLCASKGAKACVAKTFEKTGTKVCFDVKYLTRNENGENVRFSLTAGGKECVSVCDNGSKSYSKGVSVLREHHAFVWQRIRIEADIQTQKAFVWHNGKKCTYIDFDEKTSFFDGISISYEPENGGIMKFTDVVVYEVQPEPEDYPKPPVMPTRKSNVYTGMNVCSLWREGGHYGWENIVNYDDNMPILGPYDEGITEVADWEIKYMAEHGLNSGFYCWYGTQQNAPFVKTHLSDALEDGHFYAKYGDKVKLDRVLLIFLFNSSRRRRNDHLLVNLVADEHIGDHHNGDQDAGANAGHEQADNVGFGNQAKDDKVYRGRNQNAKVAACSLSTGREGKVIASLLHGGNTDAAQGGSGGGSGTADCGKDCAGDNAGDTQIAGQLFKSAGNNIIKIAGDIGVCKEFRHYDKQRYHDGGRAGALVVGSGTDLIQQNGLIQNQSNAGYAKETDAQRNWSTEKQYDKKDDKYADKQSNH